MKFFEVLEDRTSPYAGTINGEGRWCIPSIECALCRCGSHRNGYPAETAVLNAMTLPDDVDLFRLSEFKTVLLANERFVDTVRRLQLWGIAFRELPVRSGGG